MIKKLFAVALLAFVPHIATAVEYKDRDNELIVDTLKIDKNKGYIHLTKLSSYYFNEKDEYAISMLYTLNFEDDNETFLIFIDDNDEKTFSTKIKNKEELINLLNDKKVNGYSIDGFVSSLDDISKNEYIKSIYEFIEYIDLE